VRLGMRCRTCLHRNATALHEVREAAQIIALPVLRDRVSIPRSRATNLAKSRGVPGVLPSMSVRPLPQLSFALAGPCPITGRPPGPRMACGWGCGAQLTASEMRGHFARCAKRPKVSVGNLAKMPLESRRSADGKRRAFAFGNPSIASGHFDLQENTWIQSHFA